MPRYTEPVGEQQPSQRPLGITKASMLTLYCCTPPITERQCERPDGTCRGCPRAQAHTLELDAASESPKLKRPLVDVEE